MYGVNSKERTRWTMDGGGRGDTYVWVFMCSCFVLQSRQVLSTEAESRYFPFSETCREVTASVCALRADWYHRWALAGAPILARAGTTPARAPEPVLGGADPLDDFAFAETFSFSFALSLLGFDSFVPSARAPAESTSPSLSGASGTGFPIQSDSSEPLE